jgi:hypothetical protein
MPRAPKSNKRVASGSILTHFSGLTYLTKLSGEAALAGIAAFLLAGTPHQALAGASVQQPVAGSAAQADTQICEGQKPDATVPKLSLGNSSDSATSEGSSAQEDTAAKTKLHLSTKTSAEEQSEPAGQFCRRKPEEHQSSKPTTAPKAAKLIHTAQASTPTPANHLNAQLNTPAVPVPSAQIPRPAPAAPALPIAELVGGKLTIRAQGQDFTTVMDAVRSATGIAMEVPPGGENEKVFVNIGPVPVRDALVALLDGSNYDYIILTSEQDPQLAKRLILSLRAGQDGSAVAAAQPPQPVEPAPLPAYNAEEDAEAEPTPIPVQPRVIPSSVPTGIDVAKMAAENHMTRGQMLDQLQKQQEQMLDDQAAAAAAAQGPPQQ